eukprot:1161917-Pelagomonas_calceolata.AAC.3
MKVQGWACGRGCGRSRLAVSRFEWRPSFFLQPVTLATQKERVHLALLVGWTVTLAAQGNMSRVPLVALSYALPESQANASQLYLAGNAQHATEPTLPIIHCFSLSHKVRGFCCAQLLGIAVALFLNVFHGAVKPSKAERVAERQHYTIF